MVNAGDGGLEAFARVRFALRKDLVFSDHEQDGQMSHVLCDPVRSQYYRIGKPEIRFARLLDGKRSVSDAASEAAKAEGGDALTESEYLVLARWLLESGLTTTNDMRFRTEVLQATKSAEDNQKIIQRLNLIFIKIPLFNPDQLLKALAPYFKWCFTRLAVAGWLMICTAALLLVTSNLQKAAQSTAGVFSGGSWMLISISWILLKLIHEMAHGIALAHYGKPVREFGILFILFVPLGYTDASSAWQLPSKWRRIAVAMAGMYVELFIASIAAFVWWLSPKESTIFIAFNVMITAGVSTIIFNMNPLMRFDGYYIMSDLLEEPNLYTNGVRYCSYLIRRYIMGAKIQLPASLLRGHTRFIKSYGVCTFVWRLSVVATLLLSASVIAPGIGPLIAITAALIWFLPAVIRLFSSLRNLSVRHIVRGLVVTILLSGAIWAVFKHVAWPGYVASPGYVEYSNALSVRPVERGFVKAIHIKSGEYVNPGDILLTLVNHDLQNALQKVELDLQMMRLRSRIYYHRGELAASQSEEQNAVALIKRRNDLLADVRALEISAETKGRVVAPGLESRLGSFVTAADELLTIVDEGKKEIRFSIAQEDVELCRDSVGTLAKVLVKETRLRRMDVRVDRIEPEANRLIPHPAISTLGGGPIPVRNRYLRDELSSMLSGHEMMSLRFTGILTLDTNQSLSVHAGQVCKVSISARAQTIGDRGAVLLNRWIRSKRKNK